MREKNTRFLLEIFRFTLNLKIKTAKNTRLTLLSRLNRLADDFLKILDALVKGRRHGQRRNFRDAPFELL